MLRKDKFPLGVKSSLRQEKDPVQKGGAGHRWLKGQLTPVTGGVKRIWVQMGLGSSFGYGKVKYLCVCLFCLTSQIIKIIN